MKYLLFIVLFTIGCAKSGGGSTNGAILAKALPNSAQDLSGTYTLNHLECGEDWNQHSIFFTGSNGDNAYSDVLTINGTSYSETETNTDPLYDCTGTYSTTISLGPDGITFLANFHVDSATNGACTVAKETPTMGMLENFTTGHTFSQVNTANYILDLDAKTLSIETLGAQFYGTNCFMVYDIN